MRPTTYGIQLEAQQRRTGRAPRSRSLHKLRYRECARCGLGVRPAIAIGSAPNQCSVNRYQGCAPVWPGQAPDAAWGKRPMAWASARCGQRQAPYGLGKRPMQPRQAHCQQLGMRPVTLRRISQQPLLTSMLGLSSRLALPAHFHRQPGFFMCGLLTHNKMAQKKSLNSVTVHL